jgi:uncharacterized protein YjbJ (UPF0337 family)
MGFEGMPRERSNNISHSTRVDVCALGLVAPELEIRSDDKAQWQALCTRREEAPRCRSAAGTMRAGDRLSYNRQREMDMDWNRVEGNWKQVKGKIKEKWGNLTDDDLTAINGKRDQLEGKIQERYGIAKDQVKKDVDNWYETQTW